MTTVTCFATMKSPVGTLLLTSDGLSLTGLFPESHTDVPPRTSAWKRDDRWFSGVRDQLNAYFQGKLTRFEVPVAPEGTAFQRKVWTALGTIACGATETYGELAKRLGSPQASRAVGLAAGRNPVSIIIPCHRLIGADGSLTGYAGGLEMKRWLLEHELTRFGLRSLPAVYALSARVQPGRVALA
ncbi:MAG: methylated-DNA--[protein]-cysteine S-methyltransferase [Myxococcota bacterium]